MRSLKDCNPGGVFLIPVKLMFSFSSLSLNETKVKHMLNNDPVQGLRVPRVKDYLTWRSGEIQPN